MKSAIRRGEMFKRGGTSVNKDPNLFHVRIREKKLYD